MSRKIFNPVPDQPTVAYWRAQRSRLRIAARNMRGVIAATKCGADTHIPGAAKLHETCREKYSAQLAEAESWIARCTAEIAFLTEVPPVNLFAPARDTQQLPTLREGKHDAK